MLSTSNFRRSFVNASALALASSVLLLGGCALQNSASEGNSLVQDATISGRVHGGNQPVAGATVDLYAVGSTGYGTGATRLATVISANTTGGFKFTQKSTQTGADNPIDASYGCPSNGTLLYLVASGGDPTGAGTIANVNSNIRFMDAIGTCSSVATGFYDVNEVSTVVSVAALQQYINPLSDTQIGVPTVTGTGSTMSAAVTGIANAFALVQNMLNQSTATVNATFTPAGGIATVTATPEVAKINTIADIIAACVNTTGSSSSACTTLFAAAVAPGSGGSGAAGTAGVPPRATNFPSSYSPAPFPADTLAATLFMLVNPQDAGVLVTSCSFGTATTNLGCLYNAQTASAPFIGLSSAPSDWTIGITYSSAAISPTTAVGYLTYPQYLAIDKTGDIWVTNGITGGGALEELSPQGALLQQVLAAPGVLNGPHVPVIDPAGNVWVPNFGSSSTSASDTLGYGSTVVEFPLGGGAASVNTFNVAGCPYELASDGAGAIYVGECTSAGGSPTGNVTAGADIEKIPAGAHSGSSPTVLSTAAALGYIASQYSGIALDSNYRLWTSSAGTVVYSFAPPYTSLISTSTGTPDPEPIGIDNANDVWVANYGTTVGANLLSELTVSGSTISEATGAPFAGGGLEHSEFLAMDGAGNVWITNYTSGAGYISEFAGTNTTTNGTALSPVTSGFAHTFGGAYGIAVDPSGNVWVGNNVVYTHAAVTPTTGGGGAAAGAFLTEIVGAAVPVVTPIAAGLPTTAGGTSYLATAPR